MAKKRKFEEEEEVIIPGDDDDDDCGCCVDCAMFCVDRDDEDVDTETISRCTHPDLEDYDLKVSGSSGCNLFEPIEDSIDDDDDEDVDDDDEEEDDEVF